MHRLLALMGSTAGPICSSMIDIRRGGRGIQGGVIGGLLSYACFWVVCLCLYFHSRPQPGTGDGIGPVLGLFFLLFMGASIGLAVGVLAWILMLAREGRKEWLSITADL